MTAKRIWLTQPAPDHLNGLPIGTGRLAAMVLGGLDPERVALNHEWLWRGTYRDRDNKPAAHLLAEVRELLLAGKYAEGTLKANEAFGGPGGHKRKTDPCRVDPFQPVGDLFFTLDHGPATDYVRDLGLDRALATVQYAADGARFRREYLAHIPLDLLLVRITSEDAAGARRPFGGSFRLARAEDPVCDVQHNVAEKLLAMDGRFHSGVAFRVEVRVHLQGGSAAVEGDRLVARDAEEVLLAINMGTSVKDESPAEECARHKLTHTDWDALLAEHEAAHRKLYNGLDLTVDAPEPDAPTDERLRAFRAGADDPTLPLLHFNFGRYLLVASTATAELPPNLQGKWNEDLNPPWECDYHHDINLQMSYWPCEPGHLQFAAEALFQHIERFVPHARKAARDLYGCDGVFFPIQTDAWGRATAESFGYAVWIGGAAWLAQHMWWHYAYGQDLDFLRDRAYPFLKDVAAFYESYLIEDANGTLQAVPSQAPENRFVGAEDMVSLCVSATSDVQLVMDVLGHAIRAAELLDLDADKREQWQSMLDRLPPMKVGRWGQLQEWQEDFGEVEPGHRHFSHLFGLYPSDLIDPERTPDLWRAARVSVERRLAHGGGASGWSRSWAGCFYARFGEAEAAWRQLRAVVGHHSSDSMLDLHPCLAGELQIGAAVFQIDGNFGGVAVVLEMLLQSYREELHLLPALPPAWPSGKITGLRARGGYTVDMQWQDGRLTRAEITPLTDRTCTLLHAAGRYALTDADGKKIECHKDGHQVRFDVTRGQTVAVTPIA